MADGFEVDTDVLRADAERWDGWGADLATAAVSISTDFEYWAFSNQPGFPALRDQYLAAAADVRKKVEGGAGMLRDMGERLSLIASIYESAEDENRLDTEGG